MAQTSTAVSLVSFASFAALVALSAVACGGSDVEAEGAKTPVTPEARPNTTSIEIAELEIGAVDRFASCPPSGELGQGWIPPLDPWTPPAVGAKTSDTGSASLPPIVQDGRSATEKAIHDTYSDFRSCYHRGLIHDPTQDGRVAIVLRVGADGRVVAAEAYGACDLSSEVVSCMKTSAAKLRFEPPEKGSDTITIPAVFTPREGGHGRMRPSANDAYTAAAYVAFEGARPALHACELSARKAGADVEASATLALDLDSKGTVMHINVEPWSGNQELLACAANAINGLVFPAPPAGRGTVLARVIFNPRAGSK